MHIKTIEPSRRLLVVTSTFPRWNRDTEPPFVYELCRRLTDDFSVYVLAPHCPGARHKEMMNGIHVYRYRYFFNPFERLAYSGGIMNNLKKKPLLGLLVPFFLFSQIVYIFKLICRFRFHAIHAHWLFPQGLCALAAIACTGLKLPLICTSHGSDLYGLKGKLFGRIKRIVVSKADAITVVGGSMKKNIERLGKQDAGIYVLPMGVDLKSRFVPPAERLGEPTLLFVGRLVEQKGLQYLLEALPHVLKLHPHARLWVAGSGPQKHRLIAEARELGLESTVTFFGAVKNDKLPELYHGAHIVVFPSVDREGFGLVIVEALGCGCAVIGSDLPAVRELIVNGRNGIIVPQKDPEQLAAAVIELLNDPGKLQSMGKAGRRFVVDRFDWAPTAEAYAELIQAVIDGNRK